jgi:hypothetical protein
MKRSQLKLFLQESKTSNLSIVKIGILFALTVGAIAPLSAVASSKYQTVATPLSKMLVAEAKMMRMGTFVDVEHPTAGEVSIVEEDGTRYLQFSDDFKTDAGPDLKVVLHTSDRVGLKL